jgi:UDP-glucuronate decarboxylase
MRVLVTGGAGFLGSHLVDRLLREGHQVTALDNLYTGRLENLDHLKGNNHFSFVHHDVIEPFQMKVDQIYNLACAASPVHYQSKPIETMKTSVLGALNMLNLAVENNARIMQASTSEVYGDPDISPQPESYWGNVNPVGIRSCYDEGKRCAETLFFDYRRVHDVDCRIARIFNTYGPRMDPNDGRVVSNFITQALREEDITVYGEGQQTRSFCYVDDLIEGFIALMACDDNSIGPVNLGNQAEFSIIQLAEQVIDKTKSKSKLKFLPLPEDDPKQRRPDTSRASEHLRWSAKISLSEGLNRTISYFEKVLTA